MRLNCLMSLLLLGLISSRAEAALTRSEQAQVSSYVRAAKLGNAARVRSLVARPDLTVMEAAQPLAQGYASVAFSERHAAFTQALVFGEGSAAARNALVPAVVSALLSRASRLLGELPMQGSVSDSSRARRKTDEIVSIHRFIAERLANAGKPPFDGHDAALGIRDDALREAALLYKRHVAEREKWLRYSNETDLELLRVRAQTQLTAIDLARGVVPRSELSRWFGLTGARAQLFEKTAVLLEDGGGAPEARLEQAVRLIGSLPLATHGVSLWIIHKAALTGLGARGRIVRARTRGSAVARGATPARGRPAEVEPAAPDLELAEVLYSAAESAVRNALRFDPALAQRALGAADRVSQSDASAFLARDLPETRLRAPFGASARTSFSAELLLSHTLRLALLDAARTLTLAIVRTSQGKTAPLEQMALALSAAATGPSAPSTSQLTLGQTSDTGKLTPVTLSDIKRSGSLIQSFRLGKEEYAFEWRPDGAVLVRVGGAEPRISNLAHARIVPVLAERWAGQGVEYTRLAGAPHAAFVDDGRFVLAAAQNSAGFDAVATGTDSNADMTLSAILKPTGAGGGLILRASMGSGSYAGIALLLSEAERKIKLVRVDGKGRAFALMPELDLPGSESDAYKVSLTVKGKTIAAAVGERRVEVNLRDAPAPGRAGLTVLRGGRIEVQALTLRAVPEPDPAPPKKSRGVPGRAAY